MPPDSSRGKPGLNFSPRTIQWPTYPAPGVRTTVGTTRKRGPSFCSELGMGPACATSTESAATSNTKPKTADTAKGAAHHRAGPRPDCIRRVSRRMELHNQAHPPTMTVIKLFLIGLLALLHQIAANPT